MVLTLIIGIASIFLMISYAIDILGAVEDFIKFNDVSKLSSCGVTIPPQLSAIASDSKIIGVVVLYGLPVLLILVSVLMFFAGFYFHKARLQEEQKKREEIEREMVVKAAQRVSKKKAIEVEPEEEIEEDEEVEEPVKKKKK
jgi:beta-lactamase regulating signal transducer with metallopeptidase domain